MGAGENATASPGRPRLRSVALPAEHGGWGFLLEPLLLGLLIAPCPAVYALSAAALAAFLARHPMKIFLATGGRKRRSPRRRWAARFALLYGAVAVFALATALEDADLRFLAVLVAAAPWGAVQFFRDLHRSGRSLAAELSGGIALSATGPVLVVAAGWPWLPALGLWAILIARIAGAVLYVRARLRLLRGRAAARVPVWIVHAGGCLLAVALAVAGLAPWLAPVAFALLAVRAVAGLRSGGTARARAVGWQEMGVAAMTVLLFAAGYRYGL